MQFRLALIVYLKFSMIANLFGKDHTLAEKNRIRIKTLYEDHLLIRPSTNNTSPTVVAIGVAIMEVIGIDPQKQVRSKKKIELDLTNFVFEGYYAECQYRVEMV
ncbi:unnamed protein product [Adineta ricciae]|uniref:Uncharacterized protein n=1 Tax=Adineta ricciae TaxID=249248 RepID=A0A814KT42_ADIRI|nr:unnamed protein product [Adineta ricciae]